ncbi:uncharacterized protein LOC117334084 isoform X1 [Pecten maximus]|uniref:uncharacterized protein LOC117334084 isoform X1 n=1 Tax=Pecten maximus TaxID=6579 RepID=UPI00145880F8|nr:uncharacterized protein LOC117334084 isoform X1 [Pecten maximus]
MVFARKINPEDAINIYRVHIPHIQPAQLHLSQDATTQSPFAMSSTQLILPKLSLISKSASFSDSTTNNKYGYKTTTSDEAETPESDDDLMFDEKMDSGSSSSLSDSLNNALEMLNSSRLEDAEKQLLKLYQQMQEKPEDNTKILVQVLNGLADVCIRRSRMCRSNPMEWQWLCMHAISLLQYNCEVCDSELEENLDNQDTEWYTEHKLAAEIKCRPLEDSFNRALYNCLKHEGRKFMDPFRSFSFPNTPSTPSLGMFPLSSGNCFSLYPSMHDRLTGKTDNQASVDDMNVGLDWLTKFLEYCHDRIQSKNLGDIFNRLFKRKTSSSLKENNDDTASIMSESSCSSLDWDHGDLQGIDEIDPNSKDSPVPVVDNAFGFELASSDVDEDGWDFFLNDRKHCKFQSVVQVSGNSKGRKESIQNQNLLDVRASDNKYKDKEIISPLHEHSIKLTLAKSYTRLAEKLMLEEEYRKVEVLLEQVMGILDEVMDGTAGMLRFSAKVMKNLGTVKSKQGKSSAGLALLNQALETYRDLQDEESNLEIATALLELGNGYVVGKNNDDGVYDDAISAIREFFEKDFSDSESSNSSPNKSEPSSPQKTAEEEKNIEEAAHCYKEALSLLQCRESDEKDRIVVAKATMRLGDCYFMQKDYDRALECFEKSLTLFRDTTTHGREFVLENAHVMCMLGVSSFMLHIYPRAATVFELALHLVKYASVLSSTYMHGLIISFMGITFYKMKNYHRCVSMCYQAFELFCNMHGSKLPHLPRQKLWMVCQVLYVMGNSYNIISLHQKAIKYLTVARTLMMAAKMRDRRQFMRVLQILGDCHFAQYDYKTALSYYNEALEYGECESQISFDEVFDPNTMSDDMTMHNQLISKSAEAHISMQQYQNAVHYLEQAHDMQEVMGEDIKGDLISTLYQLGHIHSMAGDVDKAIESFAESLEVYREIHKGELGPDMSVTLGNLATMCYVKACVCEDNEGELEMILAAEEHFQNALKLDQNPSVCVKYGNFLYSQGNYDDAIMYLEDALKIEDIDIASDLVYGGLDKVTLPDCLQDEVDTQEEVVLPPSALARYILILSHKYLHQMDLAEKHLFLLLYEALETDIPILYSVLGYSMMEMGLFEEAIWSFGMAISLENEYSLAIDNYCTCLLIWTMRTLQRAIENICLYHGLSCYVYLYW